MRSIHFLFGVFTIISLCANADAQIFGRGRLLQSSGRACAGGSCPIDRVAPHAVIPAPVEKAKVNEDGVIKTAPIETPEVPPAPPEKIVIASSVPAHFQEEETPINFGVDWDKIKEGSQDGHGNEISLWQAEAFAHGAPTYDRDKFRLVVIGTPQECNLVRQSFAKLPAAEKDAIAPWCVAPDHWSLRDSDDKTIRFETGGKPTVYLLAPDGESMGRLDGWQGDGDMEAIRRQLKKYDPKKDIDLRKIPDVLPTVGIPRVIKKYGPVALVCGGGCLVFSFLTRRRT